MADRRAHLRFQVMGGSRASVLATERLRLVNVGLSGALVEASFPLPTHAEYAMQLVLPSHVSEARVKVRRVAPGGRSSSVPYYIGLEFLSITPEAHDAIARMVALHEAGT